MNNIGISSELYNIEIQDLETLKPTELKYKVKEKNFVYVLIDNKEDKLVYGKDIIENAIKNNLTHIPVRFIFKMRYPIWKIHITLIKKFRDNYRIRSSNIYHIIPQDIRDLNIERSYRTIDNPRQTSIDCHVVGNVQLYHDLENSLIEKGYDDNHPMDIQLCRSFGVQDCLNQGHHRMGLLIKHNIKRASIEFSAVGHIGYPVKYMLLKLAKLYLQKKRTQS